MTLTVHTVKGTSENLSPLRGTYLFSVGGLAVAIPAAVVTIIRVFVRARARKLGLDDALAMFSLVGLFVLYVALFFLFDLHRTPAFSLRVIHTSCGLFLFPSSPSSFRTFHG